MDSQVRASLDRFTESAVLPADSIQGKLIRDLGRPNRHAEDNRIDLKETFDNSPKAWPSICKDIVAMHNSEGGVLVFGLSDSGLRKGLGASLSVAFDLANVTRKMTRYHLSGQVTTAYSEKIYRNKLYGFLYVYPGSNLLVFGDDVQIDTGNGKMQTVARGGVVYVRNGSSSEPASQQALDNKISQLVGRSVRGFLAKVQSIAELPANTNLIAQNPGTGSGYILTSVGHGIPVRVASPDENAEAIPLAENLLPDLPLGGVAAEVTGLLRQFKADPNTRVEARTLDRWYLLRDSLTLPPGAARFLTLSALDRRGHFAYWASKMEPVERRALVDEQITRNKYPARDVLPWLIAAFFWSEKDSLLDEQVMRLKAVEKVRNASTQEEILKRGRIGPLAANVRVGPDVVNLRELYEDRQEAQRIFEELLTMDGLSGTTTGQLAHQLDLWLHAERHSVG